MGARSGGGGGAGMGRGVVGRMKSDYISSVESALATESVSGAVGKLVGDSIDKEYGAVAETLTSGMKSAKTANDLDKLSTAGDIAISKAMGHLDEKVKTLQWNSQYAKGKAKQTYSSAIDAVTTAKYKLGSLKSQLTTKGLIPLSTHLWEKGKRY